MTKKIGLITILLLMTPAADAWSEWRWHQRLLELAWLIIPAILCYAFMLWIMGFRRHHLIA